MTRAEALRAASRMLAGAGIVDAVREARLLMRWSSGLEAAALSSRLGHALPETERTRFEAGVARRATRAPLSHVTGERLFWGRRFAVTPDVLDPRPETETLVAWALERGSIRRVLDLGVGSGCILLSVLAERPEATGVGIDASPGALATARRNAAALGLAARVDLRLGDWCVGLDEQFDLILSNPPYLATAEMADLSPEVRAEPAAALEAGRDGLDAYRAIAAGAGRALAPGGAALLEIGPTQAGAVTQIMIGAGLASLGERRDLDGRVRCVGFLPRTSPEPGAKTENLAR